MATKKKIKRPVKRKPATKKKAASRKKRKPVQSKKMKQVSELNKEVTYHINQAKTAKNFAKAAKDTGIKKLYNDAATHHIKIAKIAQKKIAEFISKISV